MPLPIPTLLTAAGALCAVLALIVLAGRLARRTGIVHAGQARRLVLVDTLALDRARRLSIVRIDQRDLVLLTGGGADAVIGWIGTTADGRPGETP